MKTIFLSVMAVMMAVSLCFAQQSPAVPKAQAASAVSATPSALVLSGKVKVVTQVDAAKGTKSTVTVTDPTGKDDVLTILASTVIVDKDGKRITLDKIVTGESVHVKYIQTKEVVKEALKIAVQK